jgi:hypothetical protein
MVDISSQPLTTADATAQTAATQAAASVAVQLGTTPEGLTERLQNSNLTNGSQGGGYIAYGRSFGQGSQTGIFVDQLTVREDHRDEMVITEHPVAISPGPAPISDHAYVRPSDLTLDCFWSNSGKTPTFATDTYAKLLRLRNERTAFAVYTGKRAYKNMLIAGLDVSTDEGTEFALRATIHLRQIIVTKVSNFSVASDPANQTDPQATQPPIDKGSQQTTSGGFSGDKAGWSDVQVEGSAATTTGATASVDQTFTLKDDPNHTIYSGPIGLPIEIQRAIIAPRQ